MTDDRTLQTQLAAIGTAALDLLTIVREDDTRVWREDISGADFIEAMTVAIASSGIAVGDKE